jgi:hypothetical protein
MVMSKSLIKKLTQLHGYIFSPKMSIPFQHLEILMAGDAGYFHYSQSAEFKKAACGLVAQIVETESFDTGPLAHSIKGLGYAVGMTHCPYSTVNPAGQPL